MIALESRLKKELEKAIKVARERYAPEINRLKRIITETQDEAKKIENRKKSFEDYLSQGGRFVVEKIKVIIFRKPSS